MLTRLRQEPLRVAALRRVVANPHVMGQPADVAALGGMTVVPHHVVVVTTPAWEGMQRVCATAGSGRLVMVSERKGAGQRLLDGVSAAARRVRERCRSMVSWRGMVPAAAAADGKEE